MTDIQDTSKAVTIERRLDAPVGLVWRMWTEPDHFKAWYGPNGATIILADLDVRVGGTRHVGMEMQMPGGTMQMYFKGEHRDVVPTTRLVYSESMADADGNVISPSDMGMPAGHPETTEVTVGLADIGGNKTTMTMTHAGVPADSPGAGGWNMAFDKLASHLASLGT